MEYDVHMTAIQHHFRELTDISEQDCLLFCPQLRRTEFREKRWSWKAVKQISTSHW